MRIALVLILNFLIVTGLIVTGPLAARAAEAPWRSADHVQARLVSANETTGKLSMLTAMLQLQPEDNWHIYWRMPGDAGQAPTPDWKASTNIDSVTMDWPTPQRFTEGGLQTFGYTGVTSFPLSVKVKTPGQPAILAATVSMLTCNSICVPQTVTLSLTIPAGESSQAPDAQLIAHARTLVPGKDDTPGLRIEGTIIGPDALVVRAFSQNGFSGADLLVEPGDLDLFTPPQITPDPKDAHRATLRIPKANAGDNLVAKASGKTVTVTLITPGGAVEKSSSF